MAGISDLPFRRLVARFGVGLVVSEMVASREVVTAGRDALARAELDAAHSATAVQIAGNEAEWMARAARLVAGLGARLIDINMGCPAKRVTTGYSGSALMKTPDLALRLIEAVVKAVEVPVTLKMRLGWDDTCLNAPQIARRAEAAGIQMITIHGRTRCQFYNGKADWAAIAAVKDAVEIPVIANGDIVDAPTARKAFKASGADAVMVGRGARGRPWLLSQIAADLAGTRAPATPAGGALLDVISEHFEAMLDFYGTRHGLRCARKHLGWYCDSLGVTGPTRRALLTAEEPRSVLSMIASLPDASNLKVAA